MVRAPLSRRWAQARREPARPGPMARAAQVSTVTPHVNQFKLHAAMGSADPAGLVSATAALGTTVHAYQALAHGSGSLLHNDLVASIAKRHGKSAAQVLPPPPAPNPPPPPCPPPPPFPRPRPRPPSPPVPPLHNLQVALKWDLQQQHPLAVSVDKAEYAAEDLDVFGFSLTAEEMDALSSLTTSPDSPVGDMCVL